MDPQTQYLAIPEGGPPSRISERFDDSSIIEMDALAPSLGGFDDDHAADVSYVVAPSGASDTTLLPGTADDCAREGSFKKASSWKSIASDYVAMLERLILDTWACEIAATVFSIGCMVAIAIIVGHYNNGPIPQFSSGVTLNAMISVLSTAARSALILVVSAAIGQLRWCWFTESGRRLQDLQTMDDASRGPLGAIGMVATWTGGALAMLGGIVMTATIAFGPCLQQLVSYPLHDVNSTQQTDAAQTLNYTLLSQNVPSRVEDYYGLYDPAANTLRRVADSGLIFDSGLFESGPQCPTAHCSWGDVRSVGWCSKCRDLTKTTSLRDCNLGAWLRARAVASRDSAPLQDGYLCKIDFGNWTKPLVVVNAESHYPGNSSRADTLSYVAELTSAYTPRELFVLPALRDFYADDGTYVASPLITMIWQLL